MAWKIKLGDKSVLLDDFSQEDFMEACAEFPETNWLRVYISPGSHPGVLYKLITQAAIRLKVSSPDKPKTIKESVALLEYLEQVEDDLPKAFDEGGIPLGTTAVETETTTSSTSTEPDCGPPNELDEQA